MTNNEIIQEFECFKFYDDKDITKTCVKSVLLKEAYNLMARQQAEINRLNGCVKTEEEVREIMKSQMEPLIKEVTKEQIDRAIALSRVATIEEFAERAVIELAENYSDKYCHWIDDTIYSIAKEMTTAPEIAPETQAPQR